MPQRPRLPKEHRSFSSPEPNEAKDEQQAWKDRATALFGELRRSPTSHFKVQDR
jgi:FtsZ-binding cell division protein ZapB